MSRVLRKLSKGEDQIINVEKAAFSRTNRLWLKIDLYEHLPAVKRAIRQWMSMHPFLSAKVETIDNENYFVRVDQTADVDSEMSNVDYLFMEENVERPLIDDVCRLLTLKELEKAINPFKDLFWRLIFLKVKHHNVKRDDEEYEFELILVLHHAISDGRNAQDILTLLLGLIDSSINGFEMESISARFDVFPSVEELYFDDYPLKDRQERLKIPEISRPTFDSHQSTVARCSISESNMDKHIFRLIDHGKAQGEYMKIGDLLKHVKETQTCINRFLLDVELTSKLIERSRANKCKVSGALNILFAYTMAKILQRHEATEEFLVKFTNAVSLRQFPPNNPKFSYAPIGNSPMGIYISEMFNTVKTPVEFRLEQFWSLARHDSQQMHERLASGEMFLNDSDEISNKNDTSNLLEYHFCHSNIGPLSVRVGESSDLKMRVEQGFTEYILFPGECVMEIIDSTVNGQLCVSILHESCFTPDQFIDEFISSFRQFLGLILN